ncbi:SNF1-related protein kinase regulatory subunit beta-2-like [Cynara cardunculus var. scolymus]|uniref:SNF1-related protein kinase regulatory subunit beta-2-like n=1 Tax=Cynara cardunculus var. scolymus TaxID=59895 RepID=UPI000D62A633|nr:SNF1-related protein kinase regulatory subunit beta-2-like [Cynara cardunculus var. scolymus]
MGNVNGRKANSEELDQDEQGHVQAQVSSSHHAHMVNPSSHMCTPQVPVDPCQNPNQIMQMEKIGSNEPSTQYRTAVIRWIHDGTRVAIEGSWDYWKTREFLDGSSGSEFSIVKMLSVGVHLYRYNVDGQWTYAPELPHECDEMGNIFNVLNLKNNFQEPECPSSPISSYSNPAFTLDDLNEKLPELPPLLQQMPLNQAAASTNHLEEPLSVNLNHLYCQRGDRSQPTLALSSSLRFRSKFVTAVLYKPLKKVGN